MNQVLNWLAANWGLVVIGLAVVMKVLNLISKNWKDHTGVVKWCLFLVDLLDVFKSSYGGVPGSRPPGPGVLR